MQMDIIVESEEDYKIWLAKQKTVREKGFLNETKLAEVTEIKSEDLTEVIATEAQH
jgi:heme/copper-type cytochrome/quinol oxidase subunit 2